MVCMHFNTVRGVQIYIVIRNTSKKCIYEVNECQVDRSSQLNVNLYSYVFFSMPYLDGKSRILHRNLEILPFINDS